jgi:hypothetical protein
MWCMHRRHRRRPGDSRQYEGKNKPRHMADKSSHASGFMPDRDEHGWPTVVCCETLEASVARNKQSNGIGAVWHESARGSTLSVVPPGLSSSIHFPATEVAGYFQPPLRGLAWIAAARLRIDCRPRLGSMAAPWLRISSRFEA